MFWITMVNMIILDDKKVSKWTDGEEVYAALTAWKVNWCFTAYFLCEITVTVEIHFNFNRAK